MPTQTGNGQVLHPRLNFKVSFFQDVFTIFEELTGDCPGVGLPSGFCVKKEEYSFFKKLQNKYKLTKLFITNFTEVKNLDEWEHIDKIIGLYKRYWSKHKNRLLEAKQQLLSSIKFKEFLENLKKVTKTEWITKELDIHLTIGYKNSGTYDREINVIRLGIHENEKKYLIYTLYHELIHFHIINHMKLKLKEEDEEVLCRAIFKLVFEDDLIAQKHWKVKLTNKEIEKINKKSTEIF